MINGVDPQFPAEAWHHLLLQTNLTLNSLCKCPLNPVQFACMFVHGPCNFSAKPSAPLGCRAITHEQSIGNGGTQPSLGNLGRVGHHDGPEIHLHQVQSFCVPESQTTHNADAVEFHPTVSLPAALTSAQLAASLDRIKVILEQPLPPHIHADTDSRLDAVIKRLHQIHGIKQPWCPTEPLPSPVISPRVNPKVEQINTCKPRKKQRFPAETRVCVKEKQATCLGKATSCDLQAGLYHI